MVPSGPWRTRAMGSSPRKEYRPQRSPPCTDSRRKAWDGVGSLRKALTGVSVSPGSSRHTGTRFPRAASRSKLARLIRVSRIVRAPYRKAVGGADEGERASGDERGHVSTDTETSGGCWSTRRIRVVRELGRGQPRGPGHRLIQHGPYAVVRYPIYRGLLLAAVGSAVVGAELGGFMGVVLAFVAWWTKARLEDQYLRSAFGEAYLAYSS